jgi:hypothetical protein
MPTVGAAQQLELGETAVKRGGLSVCANINQKEAPAFWPGLKSANNFFVIQPP